MPNTPMGRPHQTNSSRRLVAMESGEPRTHQARSRDVPIQARVPVMPINDRLDTKDPGSRFDGSPWEYPCNVKAGL